MPDEKIEPGDLVIIKGAKSKLKPRDSHIVQEILDKNGSTWAETYKMGDKMTNRPHLVQTEDLAILPGRRKTAIKAEQAIKLYLTLINAGFFYNYLTRGRSTIILPPEFLIFGHKNQGLRVLP